MCCAGSEPLAELGVAREALVQSSKRMAQYADLVHRSTHAFQVLVETKSSSLPAATAQACMHMAALYMDGGTTELGKVVCHARIALAALGS